MAVLPPDQQSILLTLVVYLCTRLSMLAADMSMCLCVCLAGCLKLSPQLRGTLLAESLLDELHKPFQACAGSPTEVLLSISHSCILLIFMTE